MATKKVSTYRDLDVWKKSMNLTKSIYTETRTFPKEELFGLTSQARRAAVSIPSNIAEGNAKGSRKDYRRHLLISRGSVAELETQLFLASSLDILPSDRLRSLRYDLQEINRMLNALIAALGKGMEKGASFVKVGEADLSKEAGGN